MTLFSTFFALVSTLLASARMKREPLDAKLNKVEKDALFYRPRRGSSWKKVPRYWKEREIIIEVCHALPGGIATAIAEASYKLISACEIFPCQCGLC